MAKRPTHSMPADVREAIDEGGVGTAYRDRPAYQRNDYLGWIAGAKRDETRMKRLRQMIAELKQGGVYMGMRHAPSAKG